MNRLNIIKLKHLSPIHIGTGRESYDISAGELHSDTLSAALAAIGISTGRWKDARSLLDSISISSAFPYWDDIYFLPKPQGRLNAIIDGQQEHEYRKRLKEVHYVDLSLWQQLANGETLRLDSTQVQGQFLVAANKKIGQIRKSQVTQRVCVSRDGSVDAAPFFFDWHYYDSHAGLYCLVDAKDEATMKTIIDLFRLLGESGIGTDKSVGGGKFDVERGEIKLPEPDGADSTMLLSLYIPTKEEFMGLLDDTPRYTLLHRGGYMAGSSIENFRHLRKKAIYALGVGSVFHTTKKLNGKVVDVRPDWNNDAMHPVYRSGKALTIKIKTNVL